MTALVTVAVALAVALSAVGWFLPRSGPCRAVTAVALAAGLAALGLVAVLHGPVGTASAGFPDALLVNLFAVAVVGGGPLTAAVLGLADSADSGRVRGAHAEQVLRGGAWIGAFERTAVFASLVAGWPEGLAVVLALKGLGRYSELRADAGEPGRPAAPDAGGVAERFIIGTFASVLWAVACAGAHAGLTR
ncbi:MAG: hypothetical protein ACXWXO_13400 [Nocardioides sp.]